MKKIIIICAAVLCLTLPYTAIVVINNTIAYGMEKEMIKASLPERTTLVDSISIASKVRGNGNGMQYFSAILVSSDLELNELATYYESIFTDVTVEEQGNAQIDCIDHGNYSFEKYENGHSHNYYIVYCLKSNTIEILNSDLRGH